MPCTRSLALCISGGPAALANTVGAPRRCFPNLRALASAQLNVNPSKSLSSLSLPFSLPPFLCLSLSVSLFRARRALRVLQRISAEGLARYDTRASATGARDKYLGETPAGRSLGFIGDGNGSSSYFRII